MLWHLQIDPAPGLADSEGRRATAEAADLGLGGPWTIRSARGFLVEGDLDEPGLRRAAEAVLADPIVETFAIRPCGPGAVGGGDDTRAVHVLPRPGVTDPVAESARAVLRDLGLKADEVRSVRSYLVDGPADELPRLIRRVLANDAVEQAVVGPLALDHLGQGRPYDFRRIDVPLRSMDDDALMRASREGQLSLSIDEMRTIRAHFRDLGRDPTDCELETIAQTWSEHCSHKTLRGRVEFDGEVIDNLLKQTIFKATKDLEADGLDWLVSVFEDNAGVIRFDDEHDVCFKVETHNHPSAIDPYGGANTGIGGVIRDPMGTGLGAKPICNTDVFCVAPPDFPADALPAGVLHPRRVLKGVVAGVRDYGNRMGIPTVNGAVVADERYLANPLVFCGTVGVLPRGKAFKSVEPGDRIVAVGGRTGRDGIHGATFSSAELTGESEEISGGAVQIGNAITEKMVLDALLQARDLGLYRAITDCGAGGFSSAVGEMGAELGAEVDLDRAPLKYEGLSYTEIWISEAQERMVLAVPPEHLDALVSLCASEGVEASDLGRFVDSGRLTLRYHGAVVGDLSMHFLHEGRPKVTREATFTAPPEVPTTLPDRDDHTADLLALLRDWDICSKEWIVRQYDHEVQGRTVVKPLVGDREEGPGNASVVLPVRGSTRGLAVGCGLNPRYGDLDPYAMAGNVIDEAIRNVVAVGADPDRVALLDNFCWGNPERPETLGSLVLAAQGCHDLAISYRTPFISGKDSLYNEYSHEGKSLAIPPTLLISAIGQVPDVRHCVTMDLKEPGNALLVVGRTRDELGGSSYLKVLGLPGGRVPKVDPEAGRATFRAVHRAISGGLVRSCHDPSEGGLAVALAEMCLAGGLGAEASLRDVPCPDAAASDPVLLFSESPSRFLLEVRPEHVAGVLDLFEGLPIGRLGAVSEGGRLSVRGLDGRPLIDAPVAGLRATWIRPIDDHGVDPVTPHHLNR
ncbi:phosphoribosylformylglycinamidine synthase subunit PurL [Tautonia plasticadhaerens]|uniref:Phosphoribosylformylglycinamidine synthase subunit PurL n=1 Tax=Tautonia plasticadhaerens TaxID=2527974 RepID=A0A518HB73_9BACT|nr:phosphoribosylformylglycinamidine synthase subunit PurL [Tautonia plasticadhaerens]QDV38067.1 Phosphoribosylformylglycinamidine synthase subunit PurL [Tautonia plasticadhaerens]